MQIQQKIQPFIWFEKGAEDAVAHYQKALFDANIPATAFVTEDVEAEARKLRERGVVVRGEPENMGPIKAVMFEDGCGNLIHLVQPLIKPE